MTRLIEQVDIDRTALPSDCFFAVSIHRCDRQALILLCNETDGLQPLDDGTAAVALSRAKLNNPAVDTARTIWSRRKLQVPPAFALQVQQRLLNSGAPLSLADVLKGSRLSEEESIDSLMAMACKGQVDIHVKGALHPETLVTASVRNAIEYGHEYIQCTK